MSGVKKSLMKSIIIYKSVKQMKICFYCVIILIGGIMFIKRYSNPNSYSDILMSSDGEYLTGLWFIDTNDDLKHKNNYIEKDLPIFNQTIKWLDIYFSGKNPEFTPKYKIENLTPFRKKVIDMMNEIPYGEVVTYKDIAKKIDKKMSSQAVGGAVGWNPICIIIPCHRVVGTNRSLTGYGGGIKNKINLLKIEKNDMNKFKIPTKGNKI